MALANKPKEVNELMNENTKFLEQIGSMCSINGRRGQCQTEMEGGGMTKQ